MRRHKPNPRLPARRAVGRTPASGAGRGVTLDADGRATAPTVHSLTVFVRATDNDPRMADWTQPLHPLVVHLPIGLLVSAVVTDLAGLAAPARPALRHAATGLYLAGAATLVAAYVTGRADAAAPRVPGPADALVDEHWTWAWRTTIYFGALAAGRLALLRASPSTERRVRLPLAAAGVLGLILLFQTAERGGRLVYQHGVGVTAPRTP